jgi:hypothetical protein
LLGGNRRPAPPANGRAAAPIIDPASAPPIYEPAAEAPAALPDRAAAVAAPAIMAPPAPPITPARPLPRTPAVPARRPVRQETRRRGGLWVLVGLLTLLALGAVAAFLFLPPLFTQATIALVPGEQTFSRVVVVPVNTGGATITGQGGIVPVAPGTEPGAATGGGPLPAGPLPAPAIAAESFAASLDAEGGIATTGVREQPAGRDTITLALVNPNRAAATVPAGTEIEGNGVAFRLSQDVTVAAAVDTGTSLVYGQGSAQAEAVEVGPHEVGVGAVAGTFASGVRFRNTTAASGGYIERIATVSQQDMDALKAQLVAELQPQVNGKILEAVPQVMQPIVETLSVPDANWSAEPSHVVGEDATELRMKMSVSGSVMAYRPADVEQAVRDTVLTSVSPGAIGAPAIDPDRTEVGPPTLVISPEGQLSYHTTVTTTVRYEITPQLEQQIKERVRNQPIEQARAIIMAEFTPYVDTVEITAGMLNFRRDTMPDDLSRIRVENALDRP